MFKKTRKGKKHGEKSRDPAEHVKGTAGVEVYFLKKKLKELSKEFEELFDSHWQEKTKNLDFYLKLQKCKENLEKLQNKQNKQYSIIDYQGPLEKFQLESGLVPKDREPSPVLSPVVSPHSWSDPEDMTPWPSLDGLVSQSGGHRHRKNTKKRSSKQQKIYYGIKNNKVIKLYPHKIEKKIGRHNYYILWKTTKNNLSGKTFHGKFYKTKEDALKNTRKRRYTKKRRNTKSRRYTKKRK